MRKLLRRVVNLSGWLGVWLIVTGGGRYPLSGQLVAGVCLVGLAVRFGEG